MKAALLGQNFAPQQLVPILFVGIIIGIIDLFIELSFAALIFSGPLAAYLPNGFGMILVASVLICLVVGLLSSFPVSIALPQDIPMAIFALVAASIMAHLNTEPTSVGYATVVAAIALTSLVTGAFFYLTGTFHLSTFARYIPYPVIGGFLAGTGFLLARGALGVMSNVTIAWGELGALFAPDVFVKWAPGVVFGVLLLVVLRRVAHFIVLPLMVIGATVLFYVVWFALGYTVADADAKGWLLVSQMALVWQPITPELLASVDWQIVLLQWDKIATIIFISVIGMLLNVSGIETMARRDIDFDRELKVAGLANLVSGFSGGPVGYHALSLSALANRTGGTSRLVAIVSAGVLAAALLLGMAWFMFVPRWVMGGVLFFLGLSFLGEWLYDAWFQVSRTDYALIVSILVVIATIGFLEGVTFGIVIAIILFVVNYSRLRVVNTALTGATFRSTVDRSPTQRALLREHGDELVVLQLQDYIFFGTAQKLQQDLRARMADPTRSKLHFIVLDFRRVSGLDSSAVAVFARLKQAAQAQQIQLVLTQLSPQMHQQLQRGQVLATTDGYAIRAFESLDHGVEWCEDETLHRLGADRDEPNLLEAQFARVLDTPADIERFKQYLTYLVFPARTRFIKQGDASDALYFIEEGSVSVELQLANGKTARLRTIRRGCVVGEVAMYMQGARTASVETLEPSVVYCLTQDALREMERCDPNVASAVHKWIATQIAERLADNVRTLEAVMH